MISPADAWMRSEELWMSVDAPQRRLPEQLVTC